MLVKAGEDRGTARPACDPSATGDGWAVAFKMESHNHPSAIEPFQGAATGVVGIIPRHFHDGRAVGVFAGLAALRADPRRHGAALPFALRRRGERHRALRELHRRADHRRRGAGLLPGKIERLSRGAAVVVEWRIVRPSLGFRETNNQSVPRPPKFTRLPRRRHLSVQSQRLHSKLPLRCSEESQRHAYQQERGAVVRHARLW